MTRDEWVDAFAVELGKLRPHLAKPQFGPAPRISRSIGLHRYDPKLTPAEAAERYVREAANDAP